MRQLKHPLEELLGLATAQREALASGRIEDAIALMEQRQRIICDIQNPDEAQTAALFDEEGVSRGRGPRVGLSEASKQAVNKVLSMDRHMVAAVRAELEDLSERLETIDKLRRYSSTMIPREKLKARIKIV